jgi:hypothetical protein
MRLLGNKIAGTLSLEWAMHFERLQTEETNGREIAEPIDDERGDLTTPESSTEVIFDVANHGE